MAAYAATWRPRVMKNQLRSWLRMGNEQDRHETRLATTITSRHCEHALGATRGFVETRCKLWHVDCLLDQRGEGHDGKPLPVEHTLLSGDSRPSPLHIHAIAELNGPSEAF